MKTQPKAYCTILAVSDKIIFTKLFGLPVYKVDVKYQYEGSKNQHTGDLIFLNEYDARGLKAGNVFVR